MEVVFKFKCLEVMNFSVGDGAGVVGPGGPGVVERGGGGGGWIVLLSLSYFGVVGFTGSSDVEFGLKFIYIRKKLAKKIRKKDKVCQEFYRKDIS
jgi:hypothetical protein